MSVVYACSLKNCYSLATRYKPEDHNLNTHRCEHLSNLITVRCLYPPPLQKFVAPRLLFQHSRRCPQHLQVVPTLRRCNIVVEWLAVTSAWHSGCPGFESVSAWRPPILTSILGGFSRFLQARAAYLSYRRVRPHLFTFRPIQIH